ncbi:major facilitator superfamily domain-containing protein [Hysterangium stoloniferum]|nr:major facilitator superfamily domain-containing protein [Hysterangium stoloniferum]
MSLSSKNNSLSKHDAKECVDIQEVQSDNVPDPLSRIRTERALTRKLDWRLMPMLILIYILNYMDRASVATARLQGFEKDLGLSDIQYDTVLAILYASYAPMQVLCNMVLNKVPRPSIYIGVCVVLWGVISALTGVTQNYTGVMVCRVLLGVPEAAFYPGATYLLSRWYTRKELAFRASILVCGVMISNAFGALMAAGVLRRMEGVKGLAAWRWLFIIEGCITVVVGFMTMFILPDYPHNTRWLSSSERHLAQMRLAEDTGEADNDSSEDSAWAGLKMAITDVKVQLFMLMSCVGYLGLSFIVFFPTLTATLGFSTTITLLLAATPWAVTAITCMLNAWSADRTGERFMHITLWMCIGIVGYIIPMSTSSFGGRFFSLFLLGASATGYPLWIVWVANTVPRPPAKRAAAIGLTNGFGTLGLLFGSFVWKAKWGPTYHKSMLIGLCAFVLFIAIAFMVRQILIRENHALDAQELPLLEGPLRERVEEFARLEGITFEEALVRKKGFRYVY